MAIPKTLQALGAMAAVTLVTLVSGVLILRVSSGCSSDDDGPTSATEKPDVGSDVSTTPTPTSTATSSSGVLPPGPLTFGDPVNITADDSNNNQNPAWSPDGLRILFTRAHGTDPQNNFALWTMNADGTNRKQLLGNLDSDHVNMPGRAWCASNDRILFSSDRSGGTDHIWSARSDGTDLKELTLTGSIDREPVWSPSCDRISFQSNRSGAYRIWVMKADGSDATQLTSDTREEDWEPNWSPKSNSEQIVFQAKSAGHWSLWLVDAKTKAETQLTDGAKTGDDTDPSFSPDGVRLVYSHEKTKGGDGASIAILEINDRAKGPQLLTDGTKYDGAPGWSPDGKRIAFESDRAGNLDLWVMTAK